MTIAICENTSDGKVCVTARNSGTVNIRNVDGAEKVEETRKTIVDVSGTLKSDTAAVLIGATG